MPQDESQETHRTPEHAGTEMSEDEIDRNLSETFPASDPPSWTLGTDHHTEPADPTPGPPASDRDE